MLESLFNKVTVTLLKTDFNTDVSCEICEILRTSILKNICERLLGLLLVGPSFAERVALNEVNPLMPGGNKKVTHT